MSAGQLSRHATRSTRSKSSRGSEGARATQAISAPDDVERAFDPCASTASFFLHAQRNIIFCLHHDTLAVERKFEKHKEDVLLIASDNISERGAGRLIFSYDAGLTAIVWDLFTGDELARFSSYDHIRVATWMRDGKLAFGDSQGTVTMFDPATHEHVWERTIFDPVTALAPAVDCSTFAIGYLNGSILIVTLQPFTILHTLNTARGPSPITGLAWHGSSSKQKTEMLATQTSDGDLRVWSVSKPPGTDPPRIIRILGTSEVSDSSRSWFGWSKNGRIVQYNDGETRAWDVRTKKVTHVNIPTVPGVAAITNYGPTASLFTIGEHHMIQQYDLNPQTQPTMVANVSHAPLNAPPTPPDSIPRETPPPIEPPTLPIHFETGSSEEDGQQLLSPYQKIAQEMDQMEEERRDRVTPLSPVSSRASSRNSLSSASSYGRRNKSRPRDKAHSSSRQSDHDSESTIFSSASSMNTGRESMSIRSSLSGVSSSKYQPSSLSKEMLRSPADAKKPVSTDLFPFIKARLTDVKFRSPHYDTSQYTPEILRREMLSVVFGWDDDIESLIRDEQSRHQRGSASCVLLAKWLGDNGADTLAQTIGSESMTSSDWMLLALSFQMGQGSQKQVGEAFVQRLLETDEVHPAVAILLGLGQQNDAVEAYVSRKYFMEAVLLTCLQFPNDWQRQSYLVRKWAENVVADQPQLAVRCFSCTSIESSEPWFSPRAQDEVYAAQQDRFTSMSPPTSPPSAGASSRKTAKNSSLKLITNFDADPAKTQSNTAVGVTPIVDSALSPGGAAPYMRSSSRGLRDPSSARTATPSGYGRKRAGSSDVSSRSHLDPERTPHANNSRGPTRPGSRTSNVDPGTAINSRKPGTETLPSPAHGVFKTVREESRPRESSRDRNPYGLQIQMANVKETEESASPYAPGTSTHNHNRHSKSQGSTVSSSREDLSPLLTDGTSKSYKGRSIDRYISSLEEATINADKLRAENRSRGASGEKRSRSRPRNHESLAGWEDVTYIRPSKRSPSSPVPMTTDDATRLLKHSREIRSTTSNIASPVDSRSERSRARSRSGTSRTRGSSRTAPRTESPEGRRDGRSDSRTAAARAPSKGRVRAVSPPSSSNRDFRGRSHGRKTSGARSPSSPSPMSAYEPSRDNEASEPQQPRASRRPADESRTNASPERSRRARSSGRRAKEPTSAVSERPSHDLFDSERAPNHALQLLTRKRELSRKELAAKELEERRLSLARRPSAPTIPHPGELSGGRPQISPCSATETGPSSSSAAFFGDLGRERSRTVDPENIRHSVKLNGSASSSSAMPSIGLPATPRAMRHPRYMGSEPDANDAIPAVPALPANLEALSPSDPRNGDQLSGMLPSSVYSQVGTLRSASAPPEQTAAPSRNRQNSRGHSRRPSEKDILPGGSSAEDHQVVIIEEPDEHQPPVLPELQHLATPPPPPPPPAPSGPVNVGSYFPPGASVTTNGSGVINITIDNGNGGSSSAYQERTSRNNSRTTTPAAEHAPGSSASNTTPSLTTRRGRGSISGPSVSTEKVSETFSSKWGKVRDRMRSDSRNRTKSPQQQHQVENFAPSPYETVLPSKQWGMSSPQAGKGEQQHQQIPPPPPPVPERSSPPRVTGGYRNPKEIKEQLQAGAYGSSGVDGGMI